jgi:hypothetical protein
MTAPAPHRADVVRRTVYYMDVGIGEQVVHVPPQAPGARQAAANAGGVPGPNTGEVGARQRRPIYGFDRLDRNPS